MRLNRLAIMCKILRQTQYGHVRDGFANRPNPSLKTPQDLNT